MARYYGVLTGDSKSITRCGTKNSGMFSHIRTLTQGIQINLSYSEACQDDVLHVYKTGGSNNPTEQELLLSVSGNIIEIRKSLKDNKVLRLSIVDDEIKSEKVITLA